VIIGRTRAEVQTARDELAAMLAGGPTPAAPFGDLGVLIVARDHRNRHASILLALDATLAAFDDLAALVSQ
jgi:NifU-like protein involved in Fe-S cluster formation